MAAPADYLDAVVDGFSQTYRRLLQARERLLAPGGPIAALARQWVRWPFRVVL